MSRRGWLVLSGLWFASLGIVLLGLWSLSAAIYASHWADWSAIELSTSFSYCSKLFYWPTLLCFLLGILLASLGLFNRRS